MKKFKWMILGLGFSLLTPFIANAANLVPGCNIVESWNRQFQINKYYKLPPQGGRSYFTGQHFHYDIDIVSYPLQDNMPYTLIITIQDPEHPATRAFSQTVIKPHTSNSIVGIRMYDLDEIIVYCSLLPE